MNAVRLILLTYLSLILPSVKADIILQTKTLESCFRLENTSSYSDYVFVAYQNGPHPDYQLVNNGACINFFRQDKAVIYAFPKMNFKKTELDAILDEEINATEKKDKIKKYFDKAGGIQAADLSISLLTKAPAHEKLAAVTDFYRVEELSATKFVVRYDKVSYRYSDGRKEEIKSEDAKTRPARSKIARPNGPSINPIKGSSSLLLLTGAAAIAGLLLAKMFRKKKLNL